MYKKELHFPYFPLMMYSNATFFGIVSFDPELPVTPPWLWWPPETVRETVWLWFPVEEVKAVVVNLFGTPAMASLYILGAELPNDPSFPSVAREVVWIWFPFDDVVDVPDSWLIQNHK